MITRGRAENCGLTRGTRRIARSRGGAENPEGWREFVAREPAISAIRVRLLSRSLTPADVAQPAQRFAVSR